MAFVVVKMTKPPTICASYLDALPNPLHLPHTIDQSIKDPAPGFEGEFPSRDGYGNPAVVGYKVLEVDPPSGFDPEKQHQFVIDADGNITLENVA